MIFTLERVRPAVYALKFSNRVSMCEVFMRYQEFYESPNDEFRGKSFTLRDFNAWYEERWKTKYIDDWYGFNMPVSIIKRVQDVGITDRNDFDGFMSVVYDHIVEDNGNDVAYLVGVTEDDKEIKDHEFTHAMYHLDNDYRVECMVALNETKPTLVEALRNVMSEQGYAPTVLDDEIQAYITTGEGTYFDDVDREFRVELKTLRKRLKKLHKKHFKTFMKKA